MVIDLELIGLETVTHKTVYHIYVPNSFYSMAIGAEDITSHLPMRSFPCGYKCWVEKASEEMRLSVNNRAPSRFKCLFVCNERSVRYWYTYFTKRNPTVRSTIYQLDVTGTIFWSYAELMQSSIYWNPNILSSLQEYEGVFEGAYKVISTRNIDDF